MVHDPLSPSQALRTRTGVALVVLGVAVCTYSLLILGQFLVGLLFFFLPGGLYFTYRILAVLDSLADAAQRHASAKEREVESVETATDRFTPETSTSAPTDSVLTDREE